MTIEFIKKLDESLEDIISVFQDAKIKNEPSPKFIRLLCKAFDCEWGTYWMVDSAGYLLRPVSTWNSPDTKTEKLDTDTKFRSLTLSEGTAGHVWRTRKPVWSTDLLKDMCLPRSLDADAAGLRGGIWFAVKTEDVVYGIAELLGVGLPEANEEVLLLIEQMGIKLGRFAE